MASSLSYREKERARKAAWRAANPTKAKTATRKNPPKRNRPFVGVDGEGYDNPSGRHVYNMLRAGGWFLAPTGDRLSLDTWQCLDFLCGLDPNPIYVAYFFDYDVTKILEDISWYKLARLMDRGSRLGKNGTPYPVDLRDGLYQIDYMPRKEFKCRKRLEDGSYGKWIVISDVGPFFQCRFVQALDLWKIGSVGQRKEVASGKDARNSHTAEDFQRIKRYNALECLLLAELMERFRDACVEVGYIPRKWQGPGQIAEAMLHTNGIPKSRDVPLLTNPDNERLLEFSRNAFYGGRPEITVVGEVQYPVWQYDINSAYPFALTHVPCLEHGEWKHVQQRRTKQTVRGTGGKKGIQPTAIYYGTFEPDIKEDGEPWQKRPLLYGLPIRSETGSISYPGSGRGWYWGFEILASVHQTFTATEGYEYVENCGCMPFGFIRRIYAMRKSMGKDARGIVLKLALNSLYGKMAQSIGSPKYANPIWASFITAFCRTQIQELIHSTHAEVKYGCGEGVWMIATDAIFTSHNIHTKVTDQLGDYGKKYHPHGIFLVQPGLYFRTSRNDQGKIDPPKTRGVPLSLVIQHESDFRKAFKRMRDSKHISDGDVALPVRCFVGIRQALHRHNRNILGQWIEFGSKDENGNARGKVVSFDWRSKRDPNFTLPDWDGRHIKTVPQQGSVDTETLPYNKDIGKVLEELRIDFEDQPDWTDIISSMEEM